MIKKILIIFLCIVSFSSAAIIKNTITKKAQGVGVGLTRSDAVNNAIIEALGQIDGIIINKKTFVDSATINSTKGNSAVYIYNSQINKITKGKVDSYSILDVLDLDNGKYEATVEITKRKVIKKYKTPGLDHKKRRSIIIVPTNFVSKSFQISDNYKSSAEVNINLSQELINSITKTRKFNVLDREENKAYFNEKRILESRDSNNNEILKLGKVLGTDYILITSIKDLSINKGKRSSIVANMSDKYISSATIQIKVITMATRQVKFSSTKLYEIVPIGNSLEKVYVDTLKQISNKISTEIIENIYPLKIVDISNGNITLNQGNLVEGSQYEVFKLGHKIVDSYTNESLGRTENKVGVIEIIRVLPKFSIAKIIEGKASKGNIVRSIYSSNNDNNIDMGRESDVITTKSGGVVLPFD